MNSRLSLAMMGNKNALGYKHTDEQIARCHTSKTHRKIKLAMIGKKNALGHVVSDKAREAIRQGNLGCKKSDEVKEKIRQAMIGRINNPTGIGGSRGVDGYHYSLKTGCEVYYQSSYELKAFQILDDDDQVEYYIPQPLQIEYDSGRKYTPDILVFRIDGSIILIEVKPHRMINDHTNLLKFEAAISYCNRNHMNFELWSENQLF